MKLLKQHIKTITLPLAVIAVVFLCNCSTVTTPYPLTTKPTAIDKNEFEGSWLVDEEGGLLHVIFADSGVAHIAYLEWKDDHFEMGRGEMVVIEGKEHNFLSVRFEEKGKWEDEYYFVAYKFFDQGDLIFWLPNAKEFNKAIKQKLLLGEGESGASITSPAEELINALNNPGDLKLFDYKNPNVLRKIASPKN